jgi:hypothetical protein
MLALERRKHVILIWSRWGIVVFLLALLGIGTGVLIQLGFLAAGIIQDTGPSSALFVGVGLALSGGYVWLFERFVLARHLDKPRLYTQRVQLDEPQTLADGTVQTHINRTVQMRPRSTFFFVAFKHWWIILTAIGGVVFIIGVVVLVV